jgi:hypothetical protein
MHPSARRSVPLQACALTLAFLPAAASAQSAAPASQAAPAAAQAAKPNFTGTYAFVQQRSDNLQEAIAKAVGPDYTQGSKKSEQARVWIHGWLEGVTSDPDKRILTIEHTATLFSSGLGDEVNRYYFGREATSRGPAGGINKVTVAWNGEQLVTQEKQEKGKAGITAIYTLLPDKKTLLVAWRLEHESLVHPLEVKLAFERTSR